MNKEISPVFNKILIIDGSYLIQRSLNVDSLWDLRSPKTGERSGGIFGFLRSLNYEFKNYDYYPVVCWDAGLSKRRTDIYPKYKKYHLRTLDRLMQTKSELDGTELMNEVMVQFSEDSVLQELKSAISEVMANRSSFKKELDPDDFRMQYGRQRDLLINILNELGVPSIRVKGWEGDDLMVILSRMCEKSIIMTDDRDLIQMISPNVDILRPMHKEYLTYEKYLSDNDYINSREIAIKKAIEGDGSDNIDSVTSGLERKFTVGSKRAKAIAHLIVESDENPEVYLPMLENSGKNYNLGFVQRYDNFIRNMQLVDLSLVDNDESIISTIYNEVINIAGHCNFFSASRLLGEQGITSFDLNSFVAKMTLLGNRLKVK